MHDFDIPHIKVWRRRCRVAQWVQRLLVVFGVTGVRPCTQASRVCEARAERQAAGPICPFNARTWSRLQSLVREGVSWTDCAQVLGDSRVVPGAPDHLHGAGAVVRRPLGCHGRCSDRRLPAAAREVPLQA